MRDRLATDFERFKTGLPRDLASYIHDTYRIDLATTYLGQTIPHPIGKGSGQLSLRPDQLETDRAAGLAFIVLKTLIAEDEAGDQSMGAWAVHETRMQVDRRRSTSGHEGWTVTWKGRGWDRSLADYLALVRAGSELTRAGGPLVVPSIKYHLPPIGEAFREAEYRHTTTAVAHAVGNGPLLLEKDFSPTLAGTALADAREPILRWIGEVPRLIRSSAPVGTRVGLKLMNSRFDDDFQLDMLIAASDADGVTGFNRLFDFDRGIAYGGYDLSDRNLRVLDLARARGHYAHHLSATGNVCSGRMVLEYARRGATSVQLHTFFQLPLGEYPATQGSRTARALHTLFFHPQDGMIAGMLELEEQDVIPRAGGDLRFLDVGGAR